MCLVGTRLFTERSCSLTDSQKIPSRAIEQHNGENGGRQDNEENKGQFAFNLNTPSSPVVMSNPGLTNKQANQ